MFRIPVVRNIKYEDGYENGLNLIPLKVDKFKFDTNNLKYLI